VCLARVLRSRYSHAMGSWFQVSEPVRVLRKDTPVMFMRASSDTAEAIQKAWAHFEGAVGLRGRKFFGAFDVSSREYRVCAELKEDDDPEGIGFERATLAGGAYLRARLSAIRPASTDRFPKSLLSSYSAERPTRRGHRSSSNPAET